MMMQLTTPFAQMLATLGEDALERLDWSQIPGGRAIVRPIVRRKFEAALQDLDANPESGEQVKPLLLQAIAALGVTPDDYSAYLAGAAR